MTTSDDPIALLVAGRYPDPETGELLGCEARGIAIEVTLAGQAVELVGGLGVTRTGGSPAGGLRIAVIGDPDTYAALGDRVAHELARDFVVQRIELPRHPHADAETVAMLVAAVEPATDLVCAVGSGTINDLAKMTALARDIPQIVFATAPSMNGYTSVSASITEAGFKRSVRARTPIGVFMDLSVLAAAPPRLIRAGLGDSVCRPTAQADWLLAHLLLDRPYRQVPFAMLAADEAELFARADALVAGDLVAIRALARTLVLSGFGMTTAGGSYPASQGEHLISHYLEMMKRADEPDVYHGEQIGVAAIEMASIQDAFLVRDQPPVFAPSTITKADVIAHFGPVLGEACWRELSPKLVDEERAAALNERLASTWPAIRARISATTIAPERIAGVLEGAGAVTAPSQLGYSEDLWASAVIHAREIRDRYTFLDLLADST